MIKAFTQLLLEHFSLFPQSIAQACDALIQEEMIEPAKKVSNTHK